MALRCVVVDDNPPFLEAARALLERQGVAVVGLASNGAEAIQQAEALQPDVVLVDISLGVESGFDVARQLVEEHHAGGAPVILISTHSESDFADLIRPCPAVGFLPKTELSADAIRSILDGSR